MRVYRCLIAAAAFLAPCAAAAQTTTADGVHALIRGDYATAVGILRPLADDFQRPDPVAQFFMATLYQSGRGVPSDQIRACGLYMKAATPSGPLTVPALMLARGIHHDNAFALALCSAAGVDVWHEPPAASFTLGPNHSVQIDQRGITVNHNGMHNTSTMNMGGFGWIFLPARHVQLDVSWPVETRRHFIEFFVWLPHTGSDYPAWTLLWVVQEVVGLDIRPVAGAVTIATANGARPPTAFQLDDVARLRVNARGEAERAVLGASPASAPIPYTGAP